MEVLCGSEEERRTSITEEDRPTPPSPSESEPQPRLCGLEVEEADGNFEVRDETDDWVGLIDASLVDPPPFETRHESSYAGSQFQKLVNDVARSANVTPVKVMKLPLRMNSEGEREPQRYQLLSGSRRWQACMASEKRSLYAVVIGRQLTFDEKLDEILKVNRFRTSPVPYERAILCKQLLDSGHGFSQVDIAGKLGRSESMISKLVAMSELDTDIVNAFKPVAKLQHRHVNPLRAAFASNKSETRRRAKAVARKAMELSGDDIAHYIANEGARKAKVEPFKFDHETLLSGDEGAAIRFRRDGMTQIHFARPLSDEQRQRVATAVVSSLESVEVDDLLVKPTALAKQSAWCLKLESSVSNTSTILSKRKLPRRVGSLKMEAFASSRKSDEEVPIHGVADPGDLG